MNLTTNRPFMMLATPVAAGGLLLAAIGCGTTYDDVAEERTEYRANVAEQRTERREAIAEERAERREAIAEERADAIGDRTLQASAVGSTHAMEYSTDEPNRDFQRVARNQSARDQSANARAGDDQRFESVSSDGASLIRVVEHTPDEVRAGEPFDYEIDVTNHADVPVTGVVVNRLRSNNLKVSAADGTARAEAFEIGTLEPNETRTLKVRGLAQEEGRATHCVTVDYKPTACASVKVVKPALELKRAVLDTSGQPLETVTPCDSAILEYTVRNPGSGRTEAITISEQLEGKLTTIDGSQEVRLQIDPLGSGESATRRVQLQLANLTEASFAGTATARTGDLEAHAHTDPEATLLIPSIAVSIDGPEMEYIDRSITYEVTLANTSDAPARNVRLSLDRPENGAQFSVSTQKIDNDGEVFELAELGPNEIKTFNMSFRGVEPGKVQARVEAYAYCSKVAQDEVATMIEGISALQIEVVDQRDPVRVGSETAYDIVVTNEGTAKDVDIQLTATLPAGMTFVSGSGDTRVTGDGGNIEFADVRSLEPGDAVTWQVVGFAERAGKGRFLVELTSASLPRPIIEMEPTNLYGEAQSFGSRN